MSKVVDLHGRHPQRIKHGEVYVGRAVHRGGWSLKASIWAAPYSPKIGIDAVLRDYKAYILRTPKLYNQLHKLKGKTLADWCFDGKCHGQVLVKLLKDIEEGKRPSRISEGNRSRSRSRSRSFRSRSSRSRNSSRKHHSRK